MDLFDINQPEASLDRHSILFTDKQRHPTLVKYWLTWSSEIYTTRWPPSIRLKPTIPAKIKMPAQYTLPHTRPLTNI